MYCGSILHSQARLVPHCHTVTKNRHFGSLIPRPPPFFVLRFVFSIIHGSGRARRPGLIQHVSEREVDIGRRDPTANTTHCMVHLFKHSTAVLTLVWSKLLVFTDKKLTLRVYSYIFEYRPLPLTSFSCPPRIHLMSHM